MGGIFGGKPEKPKPFKPSKEQLAAERAGLERQKAQESEMAEREARSKRRMVGGRSSLLRGSALGVQGGEKEGMKDTLG